MPRAIDPSLRPRVLDAATRQFAEHGFAGASMQGIGAAAGVTKGGVYFHFRSKEELFFAVLDHWDGEQRQAVASAVGLRQFLIAYLRFQFQHPGPASLLRVLATELRGRFRAQLREDLRNAQRGLRSRIRELLTSGIQDGRFFASDPAYSAFVLACSVEGVMQHWISAPRDTAPFLEAETLTDFLLAPYDTGRTGSSQRGAAATEDGADFLPPF